MERLGRERKEIKKRKTIKRRRRDHRALGRKKANGKKREQEKEQKTEENVRVIFWNARGLANKEIEFWEYVKKFDIIGITETWVEEKGWEKMKEKMPGMFEWKCQAAIREKKRGRAKGGIITGIRQGLEEMKIEKETKEEVGIMERRIIIAKEEWRIITVYNQDMKKTGEKLERMTEETKGRENLLIGGDFNARVGEKGTREWNEERGEGKRKTKDKTENKEGIILWNLVKDNGWEILNGNKKGDEEGELTYVDTKGESVIDYGITNEEAWEKIVSFKIGEKIESDHMPLEIEITSKEERRKAEEDEEEEGIKQYEKIIWDDNAIEKFRQKMEDTNFTAKGVHMIFKEMEENIKKATEKKSIKKTNREKRRNGWWDNKCKEARRETRKKLRQWRANKATRNEYTVAKKKYRDICQKKKEEEKQREERRIREIKSEKEVWQYINNARKSKKEKVSEKIKIEEWREHFMRLWGGEEDNRKTEKPRVEQKEHTNEEDKITMEELQNAIKILKKGKAPGRDGIQNEVWIYSTERMKERLLEGMNEVWKGKGLPNEWREGVVCPIFKKGEKHEVSNYRGITLLNTVYKIYASILKERLMNELDEKGVLPDGQAGFRKGRGTMDNVYILEHIANKELKKKGGKVYALFIDLKAAFDSVVREKLWECLRKKGVNEHLVKRMEEVYEVTRNIVRVRANESKSFKTSRGVRQGCPLSATLFAAYLGDLEEMFERGQEGGVVVGREKVWSLAYADDLVIVAKDERSMRGMINRLEKFLRKKSLEVNVEKTKMLVFRKGGGKRKNEEWFWESKRVEKVKEFKYLGYVFNERNNKKAHVRELERKTNKAVGMVWSLGERMFGHDIRRRMMMFDSMVKSIMLYGAEVFGWKEREELERIHEKYLKWIMGVDRETPGYIIREETKRDKIRIEAGKRATKFEEKITEREGCKILNECLKEKNKESIYGVYGEREKYFERCGYAGIEVVRMRREGKQMAIELSERDRDVEWQEREEKMRESKYNREYIKIRAKGIPKYQFRCGNEERENK